MTEGIPEKADFEKALSDWFREEEQEESPFVDIRADELHSRIGDYPGPFHRMATCCEVMYENYHPATDKIMQFPPKGKGASMEIRYALPRTPAKPGKIEPPLSRRRKHLRSNANTATAPAATSATCKLRITHARRRAAAKKRTVYISCPVKPRIIRSAKPAKAAERSN